MPLANDVKFLTCIEWLDMLAHGFEFGGLSAAFGGLCYVLWHHLLLTSCEAFIIFNTVCTSLVRLVLLALKWYKVNLP